MTLNNNETADDATDDYYELTITNTLDKGKLTINKTIIVDNEEKTDVDKAFYVKVFREINGDTYYVTNNSGVLTKETDDLVLDLDNGVFALNSDNYFTQEIEGLPTGDYTVQEVVQNDNGTWVPVGEAVTKMNIGNTQFVCEISHTRDTATVIKDETTITELTNTYTNQKYCIAVTKQWLVNGKPYVDDSTDLTVYVKLQRGVKQSDGSQINWEDVPAIYMGGDSSISHLETVDGKTNVIRSG